MNHRPHDGQYSHQSTSSSQQPSTSNNYLVYTQELSESADQVADDTLPSMEPDQMNAFMNSYFEDANSSRTVPPRTAHDDDLEALLKATDDMRDIQDQVRQGDIMPPVNRLERTRQKRAAAARSRYQRMSENERRVFNHRRRLRQLGVVDPVDTASDMETVKEQVKQSNARKAEAARQRYHRMTPEQKRDYNQRRTEAFRRRRQEEEALLSTPAGRISQEALAKAQQIMVRNARKAESARLRYQRMSREQRKVYNMKRASSKKKRPRDDEDGDEYEDYSDNYLDPSMDIEQMMMIDTNPLNHLQGIASSSTMMHTNNEPIVQPDESTCAEHLLNVINNVAHPPDSRGLFAQMEHEVIQRTRKANASIMRQQYEQLTSNSNSFVGVIQYDLSQSSPETLADAEILASLSQVLDDPIHLQLDDSQQQHASTTTETHVIDEKALHDMVISGLDANGLPVEIRTTEGNPINSIQDLLNISHGQTVLITQRVAGQKQDTFHNDAIDSATPSSSATAAANNAIPVAPSINLHFDETAEQDDEYDYDNDEDLTEDERKLQMTKARRAERARARYHRMSDDKRKEQNARRALMLRQARARDDELLKIADTTPVEEIDVATAVAIRGAQERRNRRAEQARSKYRRMNSEERKKYNAARDAHRKLKRDTSKRPPRVPTQFPSSTTSEPIQQETEGSTSPPVEQVDASSFFF